MGKVMFLRKNPSANKPETPLHETCLNPWRECKNTDIALSIRFKGKVLPICNACWTWICENGKEW